ncbi:MAG: DegV family protein [Lachnospiraceae bacterium]|nr:DegV family protein [Lachnospiraceae bacterium]
MVQIITDSSTLYTPDEAKALGFESVPLCVNIGDFEGRDLLIDMDDYYDRIRKGGIPKSSQPPIGDVVDVYEKYEGHEIINISMADGLSGTYQSACSAKEMLEDGSKVTVINSKTLCGPHRYMVEKAQKMKEAGHSAKEIIEWLENIKEKSESFLIPQDFDFLRRGGRLTPVAAALGSVLKLKPIMTLTEDCKRLDKFAVKRTMKSAVDTVISHLKTRNLDSRHILYISHADALDDAKKIMAQMKETFAQLEVKILELSPVFVAQGGPKCVAIQYIER